MPRHFMILGRAPIDRVTRPDAIAAIHDLVAARRGGFIVTPNVDHLVCLEHDPRMREAYQRASLSLADGMPLLWMARALGAPLPEKISGSDLIEPLMAHAAAHGWRVFLFGASPEVSAEASRRLVARHPHLRIVGRDCSSWSPDEQEPGASAVVRAIRERRADLVVVALGSPKQELWMERYEQAIGPAVAIGLGASLDFVAGAVRRAPAWVSRAGLEWVYRLAQEPRRLAYRYLVRDLRILPIFVRALYGRAAGHPAAGPLTGSEVRL